MTEWSDAEISRRLALAIGWPFAERSIAHPWALVCCDGMTGFRQFDYRDPAVYAPIAERFDCFPSKVTCGETTGWIVLPGTVFDIQPTAAKAVALAVMLLEWAAKAAGYHINKRYSYHEGLMLSTDGGLALWNPLVDDGDALRLAVKLGIVCSAGLHPKYVHNNDDTMQAWASPDDMRTTIYEGAEWSRQSGDPYAATRRAIVRAAASIGQQMEK